MPATAGRVRMPANNRVHSSAALQTHGIWQSAIGYDPYAPNKDDSKTSAQPKSTNSEPDAENPYNSYQGLLALARITNTNADEARGACKKCGRVGHLTFQCRNFLSVKDDIKEKDPEAIQAAVLSELDKLKGKLGKGKIGSEEDSEEEESDSSDSDADSEIERIIARTHGKKVSSKGRSSRKKKRDNSDEDGSGSDSDSGKRKKRGRSKKRRSRKRGSGDSEDEDEGRRKRREKRRRRDESSDEEERRHHRKSRKEKRRRSHRHSDDSDSDVSEDSGRRYERKSRRATSPSDVDACVSDDSRVGRGTKRSKKRSQKRHHGRDE